MFLLTQFPTQHEIGNDFKSTWLLHHHHSCCIFREFSRRLLGSSKGGLISDSFSLWLKSPNKGAKFSPSTQEIDLVPLFGDLIKSYKLSKIKPPLYAG